VIQSRRKEIMTNHWNQYYINAFICIARHEAESGRPGMT
jgi:hypothetical protein